MEHPFGRSAPFTVLETATGVHDVVADAVAEVREIRALLRDAAADRGALIASAGTHPFSHWEHQEITDKPRYQVCRPTRRVSSWPAGASSGRLVVSGLA